MALNLAKISNEIGTIGSLILARKIHVTAVCNKIKAGRYRKTPRGDMLLTYEMANPPHFIGVRKVKKCVLLRWNGWCKPFWSYFCQGWNSWDTSNLSLGVKPPGNIWNMADTVDYHQFKPAGYENDVIEAHRSAETVIEDLFIRKFMTGTWHSLCLSEIIIKRQHNHIRIASIIRQGVSARKMYFLIGYTEEFLSYWLQCPITLELQTTPDKKDVAFKYM